jgi:hypothetical protein
MGIGQRRRRHNGEPHMEATLRKILRIKAIESKSIRRENHAASMHQIRKTYKILVRKSKGRHHFGDLRVDGKILKNVVRS